ncbi:restriction endonuclease subunit S [Robinsoniella peoriensis]|uniref:Type I restriction modification DNA specificity domain protein n=1 Tax=Robinsoniella peoriensis TaxID=180332 RepID=A0A4U8PZ67_9FIRM|nr:restriction endonuclease subunit S [Robinsoniella peoriensis]MDU7029379.1 restriction endonuclease subunit S [Clostridiales bacterium]TLC97620.1 Type I restriction modification DNA specificity domain protein [Robinsoniella peoriensis]
MNSYPSYQTIDLPWLKCVPSHWKCDKAKRFFENPKILNKGNLEKNVLSLTLKGVIRNNAEKPIGLSPSDYSTYQIFDKDELVFKLIDLENVSTSRVGVVWERGIMSSAYIRFRMKKHENIRYFYYQYYDWYKRLIFNGLGAGVRQTLSASDLLNLAITVPQKVEQDQIVRYLDWQVSRINKLIVAKKRQIELLKERQAVYISHVITRGLDNSSPMKKSDIDWIGEIPAHWETIRCKYLFSERDERSAEGK